METGAAAPRPLRVTFLVDGEPHLMTVDVVPRVGETVVLTAPEDPDVPLGRWRVLEVTHRLPLQIVEVVLAAV